MGVRRVTLYKTPAHREGATVERRARFTRVHAWGRGARGAARRERRGEPGQRLRPLRPRGRSTTPRHPGSGRGGDDQGRSGGRRHGKPCSGRGDGASDHTEGEYALEQVHVRCASGRIYRFTREMLPSPGARFRVVKEPAGRMVLKGATLTD